MCVVRVPFFAYETNASLFTESLQKQNRGGGGGKILCLLGLYLVCFCSPGQAVLIVTGNGGGNTSAPSDDFGWDYVGWISNGLTGVYLGGFNRNGEYQHWVLTADHGVNGMELGTFKLGNVTHNIVSDSYVRIKNPANHGITNLTATHTDLALIRLQSAPTNMPNLIISPTAPPVGSSVVAVGFGRNRESTWSAWDYYFNEVTLDSSAATDFGYKWLGPSAKRWGNNIVDSTNSVFGDDSLTLEFDFDDPYSTSDSGVTHEAMTVLGDSGGGLFWKNTNSMSWELCGIHVGIAGAPGQPAFDILPASVFGAVSYSANLSFYRNEILTIIPEPKSIGLVMGVFALAFVAVRRHRQKSTSRR